MGVFDAVETKPTPIAKAGVFSNVKPVTVTKKPGVFDYVPLLKPGEPAFKSPPVNTAFPPPREMAPVDLGTVARSTPQAVAPKSGNLVTGILDTYLHPSATEQDTEKQLALPNPNTGSKLLDAISQPGTSVAQLIQKAALRTLQPGFQPIALDVAEGIAGHELIQKINKGEVPLVALNSLDTLKKTAPQIFGDVAQGVLNAYTPSIFRAGAGAIVDKTLAASLKTGALHGTEAGVTFGVAQALSSGSHDPAEIASMIGNSAAGGALLGLITAGVIKTTPLIVDRAHATLEYIKAHPEFQSGHVKVPGMGKEKPDTRVDVTPEKVAANLDDTDYHILDYYIKHPEDPNAFLHTTPVLEGMGIDKLETKPQTSFIKEVLAHHEANTTATVSARDLSKADAFRASVSQGLLEAKRGFAKIGPDAANPEKLTPYDTPEVIAERKRQAELGPTADINTPGRIEMRKQIVDEAYGTGAKNKNRRLDIVTGPPAAGKSSNIAEPLAREHGSLVTDSDAIKEKLPEFNGGRSAMSTHKESAILNRDVLNRALENGDNIVYPTVGEDQGRLSTIIDRAKAAGYDVHLHNVTLPPEKSLPRIMTRFKETGRFVDPDYAYNKVGLKPDQVHDILHTDERLTSSSQYSTDVPRGQPAELVRTRGERPGRLAETFQGLEQQGNRRELASVHGYPGGRVSLQAGHVKIPGLGDLPEEAAPGPRTAPARVETPAKTSPNLVRDIAQSQDPFHVADLLEKEYPKLTPKTRDYVAGKLVGMKRTGDIQGLLDAAKKATADLAGLEGGAERTDTGRPSLKTTPSAETPSPSRTEPGIASHSPTAGRPSSESQIEKIGVPKSIGELLTTQQKNTYIDSISKALSSKEDAVLAQREYDMLWEEADQKAIDRVNELSIMKEMLKDQVALHPGKGLVRYATDGILPEVTGKKGRVFGQTGDQLAMDLGFDSPEAAQQGLTDYIRMRDQLEQARADLRILRPKARAARILQGMVEEVPVVAQEKAGALDSLANADDVKYKYKDISGFKGNFRDVYRNFEKFFGDRFADVKKEVLDPFDASKGKFVDEIKKLGDELDAGVVKKYGFKRGSKESQAIMDWGERGISAKGDRVPGMNFEYTTQAGLEKAFGRQKTRQIQEAESWFRHEYDRLVDEANEVRAKIYPNDPSKLIPHRQDYFRHYKELGGDFAALRDLIENAAGIHPGIDPVLAGVSDFTTPKSKFLSFAQERIGQGSTRDAIGGFLDYAPAFSYMKHIDPHIGVFRYLRRVLAEHAPTPGTTEALEGGKVRKVNKGVNHFLEYLNDFSNDLAGKTNAADRYLQKIIPGGRVTMRVIDWANSRVKGNQILGNLSSSVAQVFNLPQGIASAKLYMFPGMERTLSSIFTENEPMSHSSFIKERYMQPITSRFKIDWVQHPFRGSTTRGKEFAAWVTQVGDEVATKLIWNAHYAQGTARGVENPVKYADDITRKMVAGRGIGEVPLGLKSKWVNVVAPFQVEVSNSWHVMGDMVHAKDFAGIAVFFLASYMMNAVAQQVRGSNVVFDPINSLVDGGMQAADEMKTSGNPYRAGFKFAGRQSGELLGNVPFGQTIAAAVPDSFVQGMTGVGGAPMDKKEFFGSADPGRFGGGLLVVNAWSDPLNKLIPPFGGVQIRKTRQGIESMLAGQVDSATGKKSFDTKPSVQAVIQAVLFGKNATPEARRFYSTRDDLFQRTYAQTASRTQLNVDAEGEWAKIKETKTNSGAEAAKAQLKELAKTDPATAKKVLDIAAEEAKGLDGNDRLVLMLGVENGERAKYLSEQLNSLNTPEEKKAYLKDLVKKKILTDKVLSQVTVLLKKK